VQVLIDLRVVDHLAEQENPAVRLLGNRPVRHFDGMLHAVAESEVAGQNEADRSEVQH
jgi:hypothetical protein